MRATYRFSRTEFGADSDEVTVGVTQMKFPHSPRRVEGIARNRIMLMEAPLIAREVSETSSMVNENWSLRQSSSTQTIGCACLT